MWTKPRLLGRLFALGLGLCACPGRPSGGEACLPPARADGEHEEFPIEVRGVASSLAWFCDDPPPAELLDGSYRTSLIWVEGEECDPCDREKIAGLAVTQVCDGEGPPSVRLLCGPVPREFKAWDRKGCIYAVADSIDCVRD